MQQDQLDRPVPAGAWRRVTAGILGLLAVSTPLKAQDSAFCDLWPESPPGEIASLGTAWAANDIDGFSTVIAGIVDQCSERLSSWDFEHLAQKAILGLDRDLAGRGLDPGARHAALDLVLDLILPATLNDAFAEEAEPEADAPWPRSEENRALFGMVGDLREAGMDPVTLALLLAERLEEQEGPPPSWVWPEPGLGDFVSTLPEAVPEDLRKRLIAAHDSWSYGATSPAAVLRLVEAALIGAADPALVARRLLYGVDVQLAIQAMAPADWAAVETGATHAGMMRVDLTLRFPGIAPAMGMSRLVASAPAAAQVLLAEAAPEKQFVIASLLLEGYSGVARSPELLALARDLMAAADRGGLVVASMRLGQMLEDGLGGPVDLAGAIAAHMRGAMGGQPESLLALAHLTEAGAVSGGPSAEVLFRYALGLEEPLQPRAEGHAVLRALMATGTGIFASDASRGMEEDFRQRMATALKDHEWRITAGMEQIALGFLSGDTGLAPDPARAVDWLRTLTWIAGPDYAKDAGHPQLVLLRLIEGDAGLAARPAPAGITPPADEAEVLRAALLAAGTLPGAEGTERPWLRCEGPLAWGFEACTEAAARAASGAFGPGFMAEALTWLRAAAAEEAAEVAQYGRLRPMDGMSGLPRHPLASAALAEALGFFGDFEGARAAILPFAALAGDPPLAARGDQFRRMTMRFLEGRAPATWPQFLALVEALAARGDMQAAEILEVTSAAGAGSVARHPEDLTTARERFAIAEPLGLGSPGLGFAARRLAPLEAQAGNRPRAMELELIALNADLSRADAQAVLDGPVVAELSRICGWSRASERFHAMGEGAAALAMAERAVDALQALRAGLAGLPEDLQLCFRDQVADHYRWLADLYLAAGQAESAAGVLEMLKDFEAWRFTGRDPAFHAKASQPLSRRPDVALPEALATVQPTVTGQSIRRRELLLAKKRGALDAAGGAELAALDAALGAAAAAREGMIATLVADLGQGGRASDAEGLDEGRSIRRWLKSAAGEGRAAALQYVVLDSRIGIILTTPVSQQVFLAETLGGQPLSAAGLRAAVEDFRLALTDRSQDPRPLAQMLEATILPAALKAELAAGGIERLLFSLDGMLRHIPVAALHDGEAWLAERFVISHAAGAGIADTGVEMAELAAFGVTTAQAGMPPLPGVAEELAALADPAAVGLPVHVALDQDFTREALSAALVFGDGFEEARGVLHLASHFTLGRTEAESFLLLGDGALLSVADLRDGFGADLDLSDLGLLTLSACETGLALGTDGAELESFAAVAQAAGAGAVLATLWPVNDRSVAALMRGVYHGAFAEGADQDLPRALAESQRAMIAGRSIGPEGADGRGAVALPGAAPVDFPGYSHPAHWAPLVLMEGA